MAKEKEARRPFNLKKEVKLLPGYIILLLWVIFTIALLGWVFGASFSTTAEIFQGKALKFESGLHFENYAKAWNGAGVAGFFGNSLIYSVISCTILILVCAPAAYVLSRFKFKSQKIWNVMFMAGLFINVNYIVVPIFLMLNNADGKLRQWFGEPFFLNNLFILALVYASTALPFTIYLLSGYFKSLAKDYEEAAYVDGAGYWRTMIQVIMPMAKPSIVTVILFNFLAFWNEYIISMTLLTRPEIKTLPVGLMNLMAAQKSAVQYGQMYAGLVIVMIPTLILYICVQKKLTQGMTLGGLKG